ncbi:DUF3574 domain-containing protein [Phenylobacterium kunshanense]|uniref:DUF3574 domain-containing protein n=1 Tax=Phenylobacterium kunshanense TaxID=1445034 RepID=A0A328BPX6_9CAUL|nr:DUF3574 domain-containing protein [Phenylobacterium kunshanense]RAK69173.1 hypothetical protein DJ019_03995 [Phenylobacterium kunshanense]
MIRIGATILGALALAGCATTPKAGVCPPGQTQIRTAQLFLTASRQLSDEEVRRFVDQEVTPRFPKGVTVLDSGPPVVGGDAVIVPGSPKVLMIVLPRKGDSYARIEAVRAAYRAKFGHGSVVVLPPAACVAH